jgi:hypothetical protein
MTVKVQAVRHRSALVAAVLLRHEAMRTLELTGRVGEGMRTIQRILTVLREVGEWCREQGLPWWELVTEVRGRERWHRIVDHPATRQKKTG